MRLFVFRLRAKGHEDLTASKQVFPYASTSSLAGDCPRTAVPWRAVRGTHDVVAVRSTARDEVRDRVAEPSEEHVELVLHVPKDVFAEIDQIHFVYDHSEIADAHEQIGRASCRARV